jgi:hypothetical protein
VGCASSVLLPPATLSAGLYLREPPAMEEGGSLHHLNPIQTTAPNRFNACSSRRICLVWLQANRPQGMSSADSADSLLAAISVIFFAVHISRPHFAIETELNYRLQSFNNAGRRGKERADD